MLPARAPSGNAGLFFFGDRGVRQGTRRLWFEPSARVALIELARSSRPEPLPAGRCRSQVIRRLSAGGGDKQDKWNGVGSDDDASAHSRLTHTRKTSMRKGKPFARCANCGRSRNRLRIDSSDTATTPTNARTARRDNGWRDGKVDMARWRVVDYLGSKGKQLGTADAPDEKSAIEEAVKTFNIAPARRFKIVVTLVSSK